MDEMHSAATSSNTSPQPVVHTSDGIEHVDDPADDYSCQHRCDHSNNPLCNASSRSASSDRLHDQLPDSLSLHDHIDNESSGLQRPTTTRQRSGFADVTHLVQQKLESRSRSTSLSRARSDGVLSDELTLEADQNDPALARPEPPRRQKSVTDKVKERLRRFSIGGSSAPASAVCSEDDEGYGSGTSTKSPREERPKCEKCVQQKACAVHKNSEKKNALMQTKKQRAFRRLPGFE